MTLGKASDATGDGFGAAAARRSLSVGYPAQGEVDVSSKPTCGGQDNLASDDDWSKHEGRKYRGGGKFGMNDEWRDAVDAWMCDDDQNEPTVHRLVRKTHSN